MIMTNSAPTTKRLERLRYRRLKLTEAILREKQNFRYPSDLIAQRDVVHNEIVELMASERREVSV